MDLAMPEQGRGGSSGSSPIWREVRRKIDEQAKGIHKNIPPSYRRFDAFQNGDHPSIFKSHGRRMNRIAVAVGATAQHPPEHAKAAAIGAVIYQQHSSPPRGTATDRDIVVAAVGPYHQSSAGAQPLISHAKKCGIVVFLAHQRFGLDPVDFLGWAQNNESRARCCYDGEVIEKGSVELAEMLLLDGCLLLFSVYLLRTSVFEDKGPAELANDKEHGEQFRYLSADISLHMRQTRVDLLMLNNQIPFFVIAELHRRLRHTLFQNVNHSIQELALSCFDDIHPSGLKLGEEDRTNDQRDLSHGGGGCCGTAAANGQFPPEIHHLLHLFHCSRVPQGKHKVDTSSILPKEPESHLPSATELEESLTRFKQTPPGSYSLDMAFQSTMLGTRGVMSIPAVCIHDYSECVFRNLIAFEQNHLRCGLGVTAYSICMAQLLQSEADAKVLKKRGILVHTQKTDKEIVDFFRGLRDNEYSGTLTPKDLLDLCNDVTAYRKSRAARMVKRVVRQCFPRQTVTFFVIVGTIISIATLINTIHSMFRYYHPYKGSSSFYYPPKPSL